MKLPIAFAIALFALPALADDHINSKTFQMDGRCNGGDMVYSWNGGTGEAPPANEYGKAFIYPWQDAAINIRGVEVAVTGPSRWFSSVFLGPPRFGFMMVGNNYWGDIMLMLDGGALRGANFFPGLGFKFPGKSDMTPLTYIDLHGSCRWPRKAQVLLTIYYSNTEGSQ